MGELAVGGARKKEGERTVDVRYAVVGYRDYPDNDVKMRKNKDGKMCYVMKLDGKDGKELLLPVPEHKNTQGTSDQESIAAAKARIHCHGFTKDSSKIKLFLEHLKTGD